MERQPEESRPMSITDEQIAAYADWIGRETEATCVVAPESADLMAATLDRDDPAYAPGDPLPPMWSWMAFRPHARRSQLGPDGHPARGGFLPPVALPRRMFGGARFRYLAPLPVGEEIRRVSRIAGVEGKRGGSGVMVVVTVAQTYWVGGVARVEEEQDIIYREAAAPGNAPGAAPPAPPPEKPIPQTPWRAVWTPDTMTLFRYSALTFNAHRIHFDRPYAEGEEGYPGLVVHGPLTATLLAELCRDRAGRPLSAWSFRARAPLFDTGPITLTGTPTETGATLGAYDARGQLALSAEATFAD
ncbi:MAG: acyl-CoA dehydrogenase [Rhodobacteraceae bacterium]|nr:MAG: acyl-CoA dehydrogenase [Paracoccaceae bacterium]